MGPGRAGPSSSPAPHPEHPAGPQRELVCLCPLRLEVWRGRLTGHLPGAGTGLPAGPRLCLRQSALWGGARETTCPPMPPFSIVGPQPRTGAWAFHPFASRSAWSPPFL